MLGVRRVPRALRLGRGALLPRREPVPSHDVFNHYGKTTVAHPWGRVHALQSLRPAVGAAGGARPCRAAPLIGQGQVQGEIYRAVSNFVREGRPNRLVLLHGPNGSAKSTIAACIMAALEDYSTLDVGALYRFHCRSSPRREAIRGSLGFAHDKATSGVAQSFAHTCRTRRSTRSSPWRGARPPALPGSPFPERQRLARARICDAPNCDRTTPASGSRAGSSPTRASRFSRRSCPPTAARIRTCSSTSGRAAALHLSPLPHGGGHPRSRSSAWMLPRDRSRLGPVPPVASRVAPGGDPLRGEGRAHFDAAGGVLEDSATSCKRPLDAFKYLQLSVETGGGCPHRAERPAELRHDGERQRAPPRCVPRACGVRARSRAGSSSRINAVPA